MAAKCKDYDKIVLAGTKKVAEELALISKLKPHVERCDMNNPTDASREAFEQLGFYEDVDLDKDIYGHYTSHETLRDFQFFTMGSAWQAALSTKQPMLLGEEEAVQVMFNASYQKPESAAAVIEADKYANRLKLAYRALLAAMSNK